ncbi:MAG: twin-arginine translocation signal domain-containing protein [Actinomycetota bacterium]
MTLRLEDITRLREPDESDFFADRSRQFPPLHPPSRRQFLRGVAAAGAGVGLAVVGLLPPARRAFAAHGGVGGHKSYIETDMVFGCPEPTGDCDPACAPSMVYSDVCRADTWHKAEGDYRTRPNECIGDGSADGWFWTVDTCTRCNNRTRFKCHDGCKRIDGVFKTSICRTWTCVN